MKRKASSLLALGMIGVFLCTGCVGKGRSPDSQMQAVQAAYRAMTGCAGQVEITADYGQRVYRYTAELAASKEKGTLTVTKPENIAGTVLTWSDGETQLEYDNVELDTGSLSDSGLSPADAFPCILNACQTGAVIDCCMETQETGEVLCATLDCDGAGESEISCWFRTGDYGLLRAELSRNGAAAVMMEFTTFSFTDTDLKKEADKDIQS